MRENRNEFVAKNVWVIDGCDLQPMEVDIMELVFKVKLKGDACTSGTLNERWSQNVVF